MVVVAKNERLWGVDAQYNALIAFGVYLISPCRKVSFSVLRDRVLIFSTSYPYHQKMASQPNGSAEAPIEVSAIPTVVGINFGNSYASIAVLTKVRANSSKCEESF